MNNREAGILLHITSLPNKYGIGSLGETAYSFVDFLEKAGQKIWQTLPITTTLRKENYSPYKAPSAFSSNYDLIDLEFLRNDGYIDQIFFDRDYSYERHINFDEIRAKREINLKKAYQNFKQKIKKDKDLAKSLENFKKENKFWLNDYTNFISLYIKNNEEEFYNWKDLTIDEDIKNYFIFLEFIFHKQWKNLKKYANSKGIKIFGDMPIYISQNSSDFYYHRKYFICDEDKRPKFIAGVPPDAFSAEGQVWGNPLYDWNEMKKDGYSWWMERIKYSFKMFDILRIDHFRAFDEFYCIDKNTLNAKQGFWLKGPSNHFFDTLNKKLGKLDIVVEDLGTMTESLKELVEYTTYPNMKIVLFAFDNNENNIHMPHNYNNNCVCYTGTHDNQTVKQWLEEENYFKVEYAKKYLKLPYYEYYTHGFIDAALGSVAKTCIIPLQDYMDLGVEGRMNNPANEYGAWRFRLKSFEFNDWLAGIIYDKTRFFGRI